MNCPICMSTMNDLGDRAAERRYPLYWCPQCGTLKQDSEDVRRDYIPTVWEKIAAAARMPPGIVGSTQGKNVPALFEVVQVDTKQPHVLLRRPE